MPCTQVVADYEKTLRDVISKARKLAATAAAMLLAGAPLQEFPTECVERRLPSVSHHVDHAPPASTVPLILFNPLPAPRCALVAMSRACAQDGAVECADASVLDDLGREIPSARLAEPSDVAELVQIRKSEHRSLGGTGGLPCLCARPRPRDVFRVASTSCSLSRHHDYHCLLSIFVCSSRTTLGCRQAASYGSLGRLGCRPVAAGSAWRVHRRAPRWQLGSDA